MNGFLIYKIETKGKIKKLVCILILISIILGTINTAASFQANNVDKNISNEAIVKNKSSYDKKYAVIIVGSYGFANAYQTIDQIDENRTKYYKWYLNSAQSIYNVLKDKYSFDEQNIFTLITKNKNYKLPDGFNKSIIKYPSDKSHIEKVFKTFEEGSSNELNENDLLFVVFIDHGLDGHLLLNYLIKKLFKIDMPKIDGEYAHNTAFVLEPKLNLIFRDILNYDFTKTRLVFTNIMLLDYQFAKYLKGIKARVVALQPCYSGGYINDLSAGNRIICTASGENELAFLSWIGPFTRALNGTIGTDYNSDGNISILEAYRYAAEDVEKQISRNPTQGPDHPLIDDNGDKIGYHFNDSGYDPSIPGKDGYLAANTFL